MSTERHFIGVHPLLVERMTRVLAAMAALGYPMVLTSGLRTEQQQRALYSIGRELPGRIVTNADGSKTSRSNHQERADGYGHAVDAAFVGPHGKPSWDDSYPWAAYGACCQATGLSWGGSWRKFQDRPHAELPPSMGIKIA